MSATKPDEKTAKDLLNAEDDRISALFDPERIARGYAEAGCTQEDILISRKRLLEDLGAICRAHESTYDKEREQEAEEAERRAAALRVPVSCTFSYGLQNGANYSQSAGENFVIIDAPANKLAANYDFFNSEKLSSLSSDELELVIEFYDDGYDPGLKFN